MDEATPQTREYVEDLIRDAIEENPKEDYVWDRPEVHKWIRVMQELKAGVE